MATIINRPNGHKWIQFRGPNGKRQTIRLGDVSRQRATDFKHYLECLISAKGMGQAPDVSTSEWVGRLSSDLHARLAATGLVDGRQATTLGQLLKEFLKSLSVKPSTRMHLEIIGNNLKAFFRESRLLTAITPADAVQFRAWLAKYGGRNDGPLAQATVSRRCRRAKQIFQFAVDKRWLSDSPFAKMAGWNEVNRTKDFAVTRELIDGILDQIHSAEFRAVVVLARYGALRCPSEILPMKWDQVNWEQDLLLVKSPKTERYEDQSQRFIPLFPEVRQALSDLWEAAPKKQPLLFPKHQLTGMGLTDKLESAAKAAGILLWRKPWQNMRATRESELLEEYPIHVVANWLGHSPEVAMKHYAQISKEHHARAIGGIGKLGKSMLRGDESIDEAKQKAKLRPGTESFPKTTPEDFSREN